ncbi:ABC transporter substrate-binding protein [Chitinimonas viridis]|uniref:ABC transporter substrate-binding protein n=1 Tax=Chitinimonas viridis TaxID=664880 RepID=A0ABT8B8H6_9NEIS|nr:ABC transporter substrate-binding protein [Chitinimonas viridis]MDN3578552.1 ABC transporter substrate-binding protein [Chitinimonas viridis]
MHARTLSIAVAAALAGNTLAAPLQALGKPEGKLNIIAWPGYIERGETDKNYDWVSGFEKATGCKVNVKTAATSDEMVSLMNQGGYDLVTASGDASLRLIYGKKVQEVNLKLVPAYATVDSRLQHAPWHKVDGKHYGVPYQWGANFLAYNTKIFPKAPDSWGVVFDEQKLPDGKTNKGRVQAYDGAIYVADAALYLMHKNPALGIKDPYELTETQYAEVLKLLRAQKQLIHRYWHDVTVQMNDFKNEGVAASSAWGYQINALQAEKFPIEGVIPKEGATGWADTTMLHADAKNPVCAYKWMEHSLNRKLQSSLAEWFGSNPAVPAACKDKVPGGSDFCKSNGFDRIAQIRFWKTPQAKCSTQASCVPYSRWTADYIAIMGGR